MIDVCDFVAESYDHAFPREGQGSASGSGVPLDPVDDLGGEVQPSAVLLDDLHDALSLHVVGESAGHDLIQSAFAVVPERSMPEVVPERDSLGEIFVQPERACNSAGDLADLQRVREPRAVVVGVRDKEHLRLVLQPAERPAVDYPVPVALEVRADIVRSLRKLAAAGVGCLAGKFAEDKSLVLHDTFSRKHSGSFRRMPKRKKGITSLINIYRLKLPVPLKKTSICDICTIKRKTIVQNYFKQNQS